MPLRLVPATISTLVYVMVEKLPCNLLLGRLWIHALGVVPSTLHKSINFIYSNQVVTDRVDPKAMHLCEMAAIGQASVVPTPIPSISPNVSMFTPTMPTTKGALEVNIPKEDPFEARSPKCDPSTYSQSNACLGGD